MRLHHNQVVVVQAGAGFERLPDGTYRIDPQSKADYKALVADLEASDRMPSRIVHSWGMSPSAQLDYTGFYSLLFLAQALAERAPSDTVRLGVVSEGVHDVTGEEDMCPEAATVLSLCKGIPQEFLWLTCCSVDVLRPEPGSRHELAMVAQLMAEVEQDALEPVVAYRRGHRWMQTFVPTPLDLPEAGDGGLRPQGVYWITGGLGKIGLEIAAELARTVQAKLVLTGRSAFPERGDWEAWLQAHDAQDGVSQTIRRLQAMEAQGAQVLIGRADVANREEMQAVLDMAYRHFGALHGVIHAAGITGEAAFRTLRDTERRDCDLQFGPKIRGLQVLQAILPDDLDFRLLFSSLSTVLGGLGLTAYAAANSFMDAFAHGGRRTSDVPWISVNWDGWHLGDGGEGDSQLGQTLANMAMSPVEGIDALHRILACDPGTQVIVSTSDLQTRFDQWVRLVSRQQMAAMDAASREYHPRPSLKTEYVAPRDETETTVAQIWQEILGVTEVGVNDNFFELGGDSLLAIQLNTRLRDSFQVELAVNNLFEDPTIAQMSELVQVANQVGHGALSDIESKLAMIEQLSEEEVQKLLAEMEED